MKGSVYLVVESETKGASIQAMSVERFTTAIVSFVVFVFAASAIGYFVFPTAMLSVVGIASNGQNDFLVRNLAAALVALIPSAWIARRKGNPHLQQSVVFGLSIYMFLSSIVDLHAFMTHLVSSTSIPSIALRVLLGGVLLWLAARR